MVAVDTTLFQLPHILTLPTAMALLTTAYQQIKQLLAAMVLLHMQPVWQKMLR
jgi:hypothetical protein